MTADPMTPAARLAATPLADAIAALAGALETDLAASAALLEQHAPNVVATICAAAWQEGHDDGYDSGRDTSCQAMSAHNPYADQILQNRAAAAYLATVRVGRNTAVILSGHNLPEDVVTEVLGRHLQCGWADKKTITHEHRVRVEKVTPGALEEHYEDASWVEVAFDQANDQDAVTVVAVERSVTVTPTYAPAIRGRLTPTEHRFR